MRDAVQNWRSARNKAPRLVRLVDLLGSHLVKSFVILSINSNSNLLRASNDNAGLLMMVSSCCLVSFIIFLPLAAY